MTGTGDILDLAFAIGVMFTWVTLSVLTVLVICTLVDWTHHRRMDAARRHLDEHRRTR